MHRTEILQKLSFRSTVKITSRAKRLRSFPACSKDASTHRTAFIFASLTRQSPFASSRALSHPAISDDSLIAAATRLTRSAQHPVSFLPSFPSSDSVYLSSGVARVRPVLNCFAVIDPIRITVQSRIPLQAAVHRSPRIITGSLSLLLCCNRNYVECTRVIRPVDQLVRLRLRLTRFISTTVLRRLLFRG